MQGETLAGIHEFIERAYTRCEVLYKTVEQANSMIPRIEVVDFLKIP
jgi:hypothetical protein